MEYFHDPSIAPRVTETPAPPSIRNRPAGNSAAARWFLAILGGVIALLGSLFVYLLARSFLRAWEMRHWPEVSCVILSSAIEERKHDEFSATEYRQDIVFGYEWKGEALSGEHLTLRGSPWTSNREVAEERVAEYPEGKVTTCRVNPASPSAAVLKPDSLAPGYSIWFPGLFVVGGLGIAIKALTAKNR